MSEQNLAPTMQELMAQMARMQAELDSLKGRNYDRSHSLSQPLSQPKVGFPPPGAPCYGSWPEGIVNLIL